MAVRVLVTALLAGLAAAAPADLAERHAGIFRRATAANIVEAIMPGSVSCASASFPDDCRTSLQAAPYLINSMLKYGLISPGSIAGVLAVTGYESVDLAYKHNVFPGVAGQGTSNMQMPSFNKEYAASIPALADGLAAANGDVSAILALVTADEYNFGSGAWFLTTQCSKDVQSALAAGTDEGFAAYLGCIGVSTTDSGRLAYWTRAKEAFGL